MSVKWPRENRPPSVETNSTTFISRRSRIGTQCITKELEAGARSEPRSHRPAQRGGFPSAPRVRIFHQMEPAGRRCAAGSAGRRAAVRCPAALLCVCPSVRLPCGAMQGWEEAALLCHARSLGLVAGRCMHVCIYVCACVSASAGCKRAIMSLLGSDGSAGWIKGCCQPAPDTAFNH